MTREEVQKLMMIMSASFPNFHVENKTQTIDTWLMFFKEYDANEVFLAFKSYCKTSGSDFAPSIPNLLAELEKPKDLAVMPTSEAWALVSAAIRRGAYHSKEEFEKLPPTVQRAVGSAEALRALSLDESYSEGVAMSNFKKIYESISKQKREFEKLPVEMQARVEQFIEKVPKLEGGAILIGSTKPVEEPEPQEIETSGYMKLLGEKLNDKNL